MSVSFRAIFMLVRDMFKVYVSLDYLFQKAGYVVGLYMLKYVSWPWPHSFVCIHI